MRRPLTTDDICLTQSDTTPQTTAVTRGTRLPPLTNVDVTIVVPNGARAPVHVADAQPPVIAGRDRVTRVGPDRGYVSRGAGRLNGIVTAWG